jgi:hypothetical protein
MSEEALYSVNLYLATAIFCMALAYSWSLRRLAIGLPMIVVLLTLGAWYFVDVFYNDYAQYRLTLGAEILDRAWFQVTLFIVSFCILAPQCHRVVNKKLLGRESHFLKLFQHGGLEMVDFQTRLTQATTILAGAWMALMFIALLRTNFDFMGMFFPYVSGKAYPWIRARVGGGFDALIALGGYVQIMLTSSFGVIFALSKNPRVRLLAGVLWFLSAPWYFLDRARNTMLAVLLPGLLTLVFLRLRTNLFVKVVILLACFVVVEGWMRFVIQTRSTAAVAFVFQEVGIVGVAERLRESKSKHAGLNMFLELGWINRLLENGTLSVNNGYRYFAELVNPIPRVLWRDKPLIGIDYAIARGQGWKDQKAGQAGVGATISTGMIGQGVTNFGTFFGVLAAAFLMSLWTAILARQDLKGDRTGRLLLYMLGMVLTFNLGRDITLITLYPFLFGWVLLTFWAQFKGER